MNLNISFAGNAKSRFQLLRVKIKETNYRCIQFTHPNTSAKYALKVVNQSTSGEGSAFRVVFEVC